MSYLLPMRRPAWRRRDSHSGFRTELENLIGDVKRKGASGSNREAESTDARRGADCPGVVLKRGNARGAKGAGHRHLARVNRRREEPDVQWKAAAFVWWHEPDDARVSSPDL